MALGGYPKQSGTLLAGCRRSTPSVPSNPSSPPLNSVAGPPADGTLARWPVPSSLLRDHRAASGTAPRTLVLPPLSGVPIDLFDCDPGSNFVQDWQETYEGVTQVVVSQVYAPFPWENFDWYPGYAAYLGTNHNLSTHFGICGGDPDGFFSAQVQRRTGSGTWVNSVTAGLRRISGTNAPCPPPGRHKSRSANSPKGPAGRAAAVSALDFTSKVRSEVTPLSGAQQSP